MKIILENKERNLESLQKNILNLEERFLDMYAKYLEEEDITNALTLLKNRTYYIAVAAGKKNVCGRTFNVDENTYKVEDYKFIDTRVTSLDKTFAVINISSLEDLDENVDSIMCSAMHDLLHQITR